jgi:hypothetical protein
VNLRRRSIAFWRMQERGRVKLDGGWKCRLLRLLKIDRRAALKRRQPVDVEAKICVRRQ